MTSLVGAAPGAFGSFAAWLAAAQGCQRCRQLQLLHCEKGVWAKPLFDREATARARVVVVAEAPNHPDTYDSSKGYLTVDPKTDPSGQFAYELFFVEAGLRREEVIFTNSVLCLPARTPEGKFPVRAQQRDECMGWLRSLILAVKPQAVVTLGAVPLAAVSRIERHGLELRSTKGALHPWFGRQLLPLYHPGRLGQNARKPALQRQDARALRALTHPKPA